jgi:hypothetical protein
VIEGVKVTDVRTVPSRDCRSYNNMSGESLHVIEGVKVTDV